MIIQKKLHRLTKNIFYPFCENKQNKLIEKQYKEPQYPIYAFYHIYADNNWRDIVQEQVNNLIDSGLYTIIKKYMYHSFVHQMMITNLQHGNLVKRRNSYIYQRIQKNMNFPH